MNLKMAGWMGGGCVMAAMLLALSALGDNANPYTVISERNIFRLTDPPPPPDPNDKPIELPKVMLSGFATWGDTVKVFLVVPAKDSKSQPTYLTLKDGEGNADLEVVRIHADKGAVDIINSGTPQTLTLASNGLASASSSHPAQQAPPPMPGMPFHRFPPGMPAPQPSPTASSAPGSGSAIVIGGSGGSSAFTTGSGSSISSGLSGGGNAFVGGGAVYAGNSSSPISMPLFGGSPGTATQANTSTAPPAPPAVQAASLLLNEKTGGPPAPPIPGFNDGPPPVP